MSAGHLLRREAQGVTSQVRARKGTGMERGDSIGMRSRGPAHMLSTSKASQSTFAPVVNGACEGSHDLATFSTHGTGSHP